MALKAKLATLDGLPEDLKKEYIQKDGSWVLDVEAVDGLTLDNTTNLKSSLASTRTERDNALREIKAVKEKIGQRSLDDLVSAAERMAELGDAADINARVEAATKSRVEQITKKFAEEKAALEARGGQAVDQLKRLLVRDAVTTAITAAEGSLELLRPVIESRVRMRQGDNGQYLVEVLDGDGNVAVGDSAGNPQTIPGLLQEFRSNPAYAPAFKGTGASGSGRTGGDGSKAGSTGTPGSRTISRANPAQVSQNLDKIASGEVTLVD